MPSYRFRGEFFLRGQFSVQIGTRKYVCWVGFEIGLFFQAPFFLLLDLLKSVGDPYQGELREATSEGSWGSAF